MTTVVFDFTDPLGRYHQVRWDDSAGAMSGTATATIDSTWASGLQQISYTSIYSENGFVTYRRDGRVTKNPSGLADPRPASFDFNATNITVTNALDTSVPPSLTSLTRTSA
ncbi:MAG: hypothetical protein ACOH1U_08090, partial [Rhodoglobus sp.]